MWSARLSLRNWKVSGVSEELELVGMSGAGTLKTVRQERSVIRNLVGDALPIESADAAPQVSTRAKGSTMPKCSCSSQYLGSLLAFFCILGLFVPGPSRADSTALPFGPRHNENGRSYELRSRRQCCIISSGFEALSLRMTRSNAFRVRDNRD